jgi:hypothetical protein
MTKIPLWAAPNNWNPSEQEGRTAFLKGLPMDHQYGECLAAKDWERGWRSAEAHANKR